MRSKNEEDEEEGIETAGEGRQKHTISTGLWRPSGFVLVTSRLYSTALLSDGPVAGSTVVN